MAHALLKGNNKQGNNKQSVDLKLILFLLLQNESARTEKDKFNGTRSFIKPRSHPAGQRREEADSS